MENYCAFSKNHKCINWTDYELTRYELEEAGSLCQANFCPSVIGSMSRITY